MGSGKALNERVSIQRFTEFSKEQHSISLEQEIHSDFNFQFLYCREEQKRNGMQEIWQ